MVVCRRTSGNFWVCSLTTVSLSRWPLFYLVSYRLVRMLHFLQLQLALYTLVSRPIHNTVQISSVDR